MAAYQNAFLSGSSSSFAYLATQDHNPGFFFLYYFKLPSLGKFAKCNQQCFLLGLKVF